MTIHEFGERSAPVVLLQPVDDHDLSTMENEVRTLCELTDTDFHLIAVKVDNWNTDLSPWAAAAVFGNEDFGNGAAFSLNELLKLCADEDKTYYIGGYSLAGLFALWAAYQTDRFVGVAAASPSVWFPGFTDFMRGHMIRTTSVYLSLGDREEKVRNPVMATVGDRIRQSYDILNRQNVKCVLEWNRGNHFKDADIRTAKAFAWLLTEEA